MSENAAIVASGLTSITGLPIITQTDCLNQIENGNNNVIYQNINPLSLHNSCLAGGEVSTISQQDYNVDSNPPSSCSPLCDHCSYLQGDGNVNKQPIIYISSQIISSFNIQFFSSPIISMNSLMMSSLQHQQIQPQISQQISFPQQIQPQISQQNLFQQIPNHIPQDSIVITINISTLNGQIIPINNVPIKSKIFAIKFHIESKTRIPSNQQRLIYSGIILKDNLTLLDYKILNNNSTIQLIGQINGVISFIDSDFLDPIYDCDFTNVKDNKTFMRGSHVYRRPCGWKRIAVKVLNKYGPDNTWLGTNAKKGSWRYDSDPMEWPVSYHGTDKFNAKSIAETGFDITKGKRFKFGRGVYSTPDIEIAALYAKRFVYNNESYCLVFQNRVNPNTLTKINTNIGEYWISPKSDDIRPYGICIKKI